MPFFPTPQAPDLWHYLQSETAKGRPLLLYGMGNGADKIISVCNQYGIPVSDVFASDGFVRGHSFHGKRVLSFTEAKEIYGSDMIILLSFASSRPDVLELIQGVAAQCELYAPDVPVCGDTLFNSEFYEAHKAEFQAARALLTDDESRQVWDSILTYKLSGRIDLLRATETTPQAVFTSLLSPKSFRTTADLGAYTGDSIRELSAYADNLSTVIAFEPDARNFRKLTAYAEGLVETQSPCTVHPVNAGAWCQDGTLLFHGSGNRNATLCGTDTAEAQTNFQVTDAYFGKSVEVKVATLDRVAAELLGDTPVDYIKYDVEGAEKEALQGSSHLIRTYAPTLLVSCYHRSEDLFTLPLLVHRLQPEYKLYLRRMAGIPAWDINLYAIK